MLERRTGSMSRVRRKLTSKTCFSSNQTTVSLVQPSEQSS